MPGSQGDFRQFVRREEAKYVFSIGPKKNSVSQGGIETGGKKRRRKVPVDLFLYRIGVE